MVDNDAHGEHSSEHYERYYDWVAWESRCRRQSDWWRAHCKSEADSWTMCCVAAFLTGIVVGILASLVM